MSLDWNSLIKSAETDLAKALTAKVVAGIVASVPWLGAISGPLGFLLGILVGQMIKYGDWMSYMVLDDWKNTSEGKAYEDAAIANAQIPKGDPRKKDTEAAQKAAFDALLGAG